MPSKLKLCSESIVLEVSIAFYQVDFYFLFFSFFLTNHNFTVVYSCIVSIIIIILFFFCINLLISGSIF